MNRKQTAFLRNLTVARAERLLDKFNYDPANALAAGEDTYSAFSQCWELVYPNEYIQRVTSFGDGRGVRFNFLSTAASAFED